MSELTKEWLLKTIAELGEERDATPGAVSEDAFMALAAMKIALASLEAESVAFRSKLKPPSSIGSERWDYTDHRQPDAFELENCVIERLYNAPPAPTVPDKITLANAPEVFEIAAEAERLVLRGAYASYAVGWNACRAAMLKSFGNSEQLNSPVIPDGYVLVPIEPTMAMLDEFDSIVDYGSEDSKDAWSRLIAAAPQQEVK
ncbi:hypothetical protein RJO53_003011 [Enterobacter hormaechei]|uniref:hypothetical protein n=1 Tax=Enterobacter hormaechei TaxID=158836 RepID=UPI000799941E|nr:hypothetical protein [Enterobacter hormaechei]ELC6297091.1 hypothetical protein [Enterobacter hormaechei]ELC6543340.1 hypothetical protein [Enterobacter hormaechei]CZW64991.1 Uncharacterised protein [Enterobacter hormaechei]HDT5169967.1 hypothetical protein [Enterobacter hormaechei subsp. steigerwaltii]HDT5188926.1 hypothetical protein [Enterobacter hormaechei subsp. steigerwaltii]